MKKYIFVVFQINRLDGSSFPVKYFSNLDVAEKYRFNMYSDDDEKFSGRVEMVEVI